MEISGLPESVLQKPQEVIKSVAVKLKMDEGDVKCTRVMQPHKERSGSLVVEVKNQHIRDQWLAATKQTRSTLGDIVQSVPRELTNTPIFIREALTPYNKMLLYNSKKQLSNNFEFVWCKNGRIYARKTKVSKVHIIRCLLDIEAISKSEK